MIKASSVPYQVEIVSVLLKKKLMTWFESEVVCFRQLVHEEQWGHVKASFLPYLLFNQVECLCFVEKEKMIWFQSEIVCVRHWGLEEQWGHDH